MVPSGSIPPITDGIRRRLLMPPCSSIGRKLTLSTNVGWQLTPSSRKPIFGKFIPDSQKFWRGKPPEKSVCRDRRGG